MLGPSEGTRNVRAVSVSSLLTGTYNNLLSVVLQPFVVALTNSVVILGILQTLATRIGGVVGSVAQLLGGLLADRWGRRSVMLMGSAMNLVSLTCFLLAALAASWPFLVPAFVFLGMGLLSSPATQSTVAESVALRGRAMAYSQVQFFLIAPAAVVAFVGGYVADRFGVGVIFAASLALEAVNFVLFALLLRETLADRNGGPWSRARIARLREPRLRALLIVASVDAFAWTVSTTLIYGMAVQQFGFTDTDVGIIVGVWAAVFAAASLPVGKLVERFGSRRLLFFSESLGIPVMVGWLLSTTTLGFVVVSLFNGLVAATWNPAWQTLLANSVDDRVRGEVTGQISAVRGVLAFPAPVVGALLYAALGYDAPMVASLAGVIVAIVAVLLLIRDNPALPTAPPSKRS